MIVLLENYVHGNVNGLPFSKQALKHLFAVWREPVKPLVAFVFFTPFACKQALCFKPSKQRIKSVLVHFQSVVGECFAERITVSLTP